MTYIKDDNYGEELQAFALQYFLNKNGYDAEVIDLEKRLKDLSKSKETILPAIINRFKVYGVQAPIYIVKKVIDVYRKRRFDRNNQEYKEIYHKQFVDFFNAYTKHSESFYTLERIRSTMDLSYDTFIAGSDQIWNFMHTDFLDVFFLEFAKKFKAKRISYAASISVSKIPDSMKKKYQDLIKNIDYLSVREIQGAELLKGICGRDAEVVLDPTLLLNKQDWIDTCVYKLPLFDNYVLVYTLSGSRQIKKLAYSISNSYKCSTIIFIIGDRSILSKEGTETPIIVGPSEWLGLFLKARYVVTDSFHGTAFSINFNIPFTTLVNPVSNMNSRVLSILTITKLMGRIVYDGKKIKIPEVLNIDFSEVNEIIDSWRKKSFNFLYLSLKNESIN